MPTIVVSCRRGRPPSIRGRPHHQRRSAMPQVKDGSGRDEMAGGKSHRDAITAASMDVQGFTTAVDAILDLHHLGHARADLVTGGVRSIDGLSAMKGHGSQEG